MCITVKPFLKTLQGQKSQRVPIWFMRQAGRYLPEYLKLREEAKDFISFCLTPSLAIEATLQPLRRFDLDAAILFADILLIPLALGQEVRFIKGEGPRLKALMAREDIKNLTYDPQKLKPIGKTVQGVKARLDAHQTLIGFAGSPWTVACYMIDGQGGLFQKSKDWTATKPEDLRELITIITNATISYLKMQIEAGAEVIQLFDSHAGLLSGNLFDRFVIEPNQQIVKALRADYPDVGFIGFPRGASPEQYEKYAQQVGIDVIGIDQKTSLAVARKCQSQVNAVQGNLDPELLLRGGEYMEQAAAKILDSLSPHLIFNLGHGVIKETPPEHVEQLISFVRSREHK